MLTRGYVGSSSTGGGPTPSVRVWGEQPGGAIDGSNLTFVTAQKFQAGTEAVFLNGVRQRVGGSNDYTRSESVPAAGLDLVVFTLPPRNGDVILVDYDPT